MARAPRTKEAARLVVKAVPQWSCDNGRCGYPSLGRTVSAQARPASISQIRISVTSKALDRPDRLVSHLVVSSTTTLPLTSGGPARHGEGRKCCGLSTAPFVDRFLFAATNWTDHTRFASTIPPNRNSS